MKHYRHGDLLIAEVDIFAGERVITRWLPDEKRIVLLKGEATGHSHALEPTEGSRVKLFESETGDKYFEVTGTALLVHEEHRTIEIPEGRYRVVRQRVYTPQAIEYVRD